MSTTSAVNNVNRVNDVNHVQKSDQKRGDCPRVIDQAIHREIIAIVKEEIDFRSSQSSAADNPSPSVDL
jgi:hypothetical protein